MNSWLKQQRFDGPSDAGLRTRALELLLMVTLLAFAGRAWGQSAANLPASLHGRFTEGVEAQKAGRLEEAEGIFREILARGGRASFVYNNLGVIYQMRREHERAVLQFREAIRLQPDYAAPQILLGASLLALGKVSEATQHLEKAVNLQPQELRAREQLARAYERGGNFRGCVEQYQALRKLKSHEPEYAYQLANAYLKLAAWCHRELATHHPNSARILQFQAENYHVQGRLDLAARTYQRVAQADPTLPEIHYLLALIYLEQGKTAEAQREVERELAVVPFSIAALELKKKLDARSPSP
jgi:Flp pilus assembly protein TadD